MSKYTLQAQTINSDGWDNSIHNPQIRSLTLAQAWDFADQKTRDSMAGLKYRVAEVITVPEVTTMAEAPRPLKEWELHKRYQDAYDTSTTTVTVDALSEDGWAMVREGEDGTRYVAAPGSRHNYTEV